MIDLGISKIALVGAVALVVIGPERLPRRLQHVEDAPATGRQPFGFGVVVRFGAVVSHRNNITSRRAGFETCRSTPVAGDRAFRPTLTGGLRAAARELPA